MIATILYILLAGFLISKMKHQEDMALMMIFVVVIGIFILASQPKTINCNAIGDCQELDTYAIE